MSRHIQYGRRAQVTASDARNIAAMKMTFPWVICGCLLAACTRQPPSVPDSVYGRGGQTQWLRVPQGRLKSEVYSSSTLSAHPTLVVVLHGDLPNPTPSYQYGFAQLITQGSDAPGMPEAMRSRLGISMPAEDTIAVGILRPGYTDNAGDRSDGDMGNAADDNFTPEVTDAIAIAVNSLKAKYAAHRVVLVGHSGGGAIVANVLGRHPELADGALLVACGCDPEASRARMRKTRGSPIWKGSTQSLQPMELVPGVRTNVTVRLIVGQEDLIAPPEDSLRYAKLLKNRGVDATVTVVPSFGHNILFAPAVVADLATLLH
jgi:predicted esterase